jgi:hypothetical protein
MIHSKLLPSDQLLVHVLDKSEIPAGYLPQWIWDWLNRARDPVNGTAIAQTLSADIAALLSTSKPNT